VGQTLLIGSARTTWREWLRANRHDVPLLCLDPTDPTDGPAGILTLQQGDKILRERFYGSLDPQRHPHVLIAFLAEAIQLSREDLMVQLFPYRATPVLRQTVQLVAQVMQPDRILIGCGTEIDQSGFPVGPESVELEPAFPPMVQQAQRKAHWLRMLERCQRQTVDLRKVTLEGSRLGSGVSLSAEERKTAGLQNAVHAERIGASLLVVSDADFEESEVSVALDYAGCTRAVFAEPGAYRNLLCSFARQDGIDFAYGIVAEIDWRSLRAQVLSTAIPPAPVRILRLGSLRVDASGREMGELRSWQA
jgi:hypothetical protein